MAAGGHFENNLKKSCVLIWNGEKSYQKSFSVIHNGRRQPFCEKNKIKVAYLSEMARNVIESDFRSSKMATGSHFVNKKVAYWSEMARNVIESDFWSSTMAADSHFGKKIVYLSEMVRNAIESDFWSSKMATGSHIVKKKSKLRIDLKWREMRSKVIFGHPKWPPAAILWKKCVFIWNGEKCVRKWFLVIQNGHRQPYCEKKSKLRIDLKWWEMRSKAIFGHPKWPPAAILWKKKIVYLSEMARNAIESDFRSSAAILWKKNQSCVLIWNAEKCDRKWFLVIQHGRRQPFCEQNCVFIWNGEKCDRKYWWKKSKKLSCYWSEMLRNSIESDFRSSKMAAGSHLVKKKISKLRIDLKWREMRSKAWSSKMATGSHLVKKICVFMWKARNAIESTDEKNKTCYWSDMSRNAIESDFRSSKIATISHFINEIKSDFRSKWPPILVFPLSAHEASPGWWQRKGHCQGQKGQVWLIFTYFFKLISSIELLPKCIASCSFSEVILVLFLNFNGVDWF